MPHNLLLGAPMPSALRFLLPPADRYRREWWWLGVAGLLIALLLVADLWTERRLLVRREQQHLMQQTQIIRASMERQFTAVNQTLENLLEVIAQSSFTGSDDVHEKVQERLLSLSQAMVGVGILTWIDKDGQVLAASAPSLIGRDFSQRPYFQTAKNTMVLNDLIVSPPFAPEPKLWVLTLARPVLDAQGEFDGVVTAVLRPEDFADLLRSVLFAPDARAGLIQGGGQTFALQTLQDKLPGATPPPGYGQALLRQFWGQGQDAAVLQGPLLPHEGPRLVAVQMITPPGIGMDTPMLVGVGRDVQAMFAPWYARLWVSVGLYAVLALLSALGLHLIQSNLRRVQVKEQALSELWHAVLTATGQGVWDYDVVHQRVYFSSTWKRALGYADDEVGDSLQEWQSRIHPDDQRQTQQAWQQYVRGESPTYESVHRLRCKDGSYRWVWGRGSIIERDAQGLPTRIVGTNTDVTEERRLRERFEHLTQNVPGMIYQFQLEPDGRGHFPYTSQGVLNVYGLQPEQVQRDGRLALQVIHPDDLPQVLASIRQSADTLTVWHQQYRVQSPNGQERWVSGQAQPQRLEGGAVLWHGYILDITDAKLQALELEKAQRMLEHLIHTMPVALCMVDDQRRIYLRNQRFLDYFGYTEADVPTMDAWAEHAYPDPAYRQEVGQAWRQALAHAQAHDGYIPSQEYRITNQAGQELVVAISGVRFGHNFLVTFADRTAQHTYSAMLEQMAFVDALTNLPNRRRFDEALQAEWLRCQRSQRPLAVLMMDIDYFKQYNDHYGHPEGDACLRAVAQVLHGCLGRSYDLVARYGGEEFVCLLPECSLEGARSKAQAMLQAVRDLQRPHAYARNQAEAEGAPLGAGIVTISIGVAAMLPQEGVQATALLAQADAHLYAAKTAGRNQVHAGEEMNG